MQLLGGVGRQGRGYLLGAVELEEHRLQRLDQGDVQPVHPDDAFLRLVTVVVPGPARRQYEISRLHIEALAIDGRIGTAPFNDKANRSRRMAVSAGDLSRQKHLYCCDKIVCRRPAAIESWVEKLKCPALLYYRRRRAPL